MRKGNTHETERLLNEIEEHAKLHKQWSWVQMAHERLGAALWDIDRKAAIQAYVAGMTKIGGDKNLDGLFSTGIQLLGQLHELGLAKGKKVVSDLQKQTEAWLRAQLHEPQPPQKGRIDVNILRWLLWPFELTLTVLSRPDKGRNVKAGELERFLLKTLTSSRLHPSNSSI
jgi:hypothetical protein